MVEADESDGSFLMLAPDARDRHLGRGRPPDNYEGRYAAIEQAFSPPSPSRITDGGAARDVRGQRRRAGAMTAAPYEQ